MNLHASPAEGGDEEIVRTILARQPRAHSLQQALYNSEAAYRHDIDRIFAHHWMLAGHASQAAKPGDYFLCEVAGESFIILRDTAGRLRAFANVCRHRGSRICLKSEGRASVLVCPYHAWSYNLDGTLRAARHMGPEFDRRDFGLRPVHLDEIEGLVFISQAENPLSLGVARDAITRAFGAYGWASAKVAHRETYMLKANWKLAVENYLECYHCTPSHPEYSKLHALERPLDQIAGMNAAMEARTRALGFDVPSVDHQVSSSTGEASIFIFRYPLYDGVKTGGPAGQAIAPLMGRFTEYDGGVTSAHFAPSSFFIAYPDHGVIYRFMPADARSSAMELIWLVKGEAKEGADYDLERLTWLWKVTTDADKRITEDNQKGVNSRYYEPGPYSPMEPNAIRWIDWYLSEIA